MQLVKTKYGSCVKDSNGPLNISLSATFISRFTNDDRWFGRLRLNNTAALCDAYKIAQCEIPVDIIVKFPYRYKRFGCYVSKNGAPSSVYDITRDDDIDCIIQMTNISDNEVYWKFNSINIRLFEET